MLYAYVNELDELGRIVKVKVGTFKDVAEMEEAESMGMNFDFVVDEADVNNLFVENEAFA